MARLGLETTLIDADAYGRTLVRFREAGVALPTIGQLKDPSTIAPGIAARLRAVDPDLPHPLNLFRVHWFNDAARSGRAETPGHIELPPRLTGVPARIVAVPGNRFPMIRAHKVLAAYGCLVPRVVTGQFDPTRHRAIWPSTGNYCRGGVAISRILGCRAAAVLPEAMSRERFDWLKRWVADEADVIRTAGSESNVKEIYDACAALDRDPANIVFNQFCEFGNYVVHRVCTGTAMEKVFRSLAAGRAHTRLAAFVAATGSAGTLGAGDHLKQACGARIVAAEALECPTLLYNGYGEHNIQGIGDKHIPLIHNVMNTDAVIAVSDQDTDRLNLASNSPEGAAYFASRRDIDPSLAAVFGEIGISSWANILASVKLARTKGYGPDDAIVTIATDSARLYRTEADGARRKFFAGGFGARDAASVVETCLTGASTENVLLLGPPERRRIFNLGYYTWVEQQGISVEDFDRRKDQDFWRGVAGSAREWDRLITEFNCEAGID